MNHKLKVLLTKFPRFQDNFKKLTTNCELKLKGIEGLDVLPMNSVDNIGFEVLGKHIELRFKMVFHGENLGSYGQISAYLIEKTDSTQKSEILIKSFWFDNPGNIFEDLEKSYAAYAVSEDGALSYIVINTLEVLIETEEFQLNING